MSDDRYEEFSRERLDKGVQGIAERLRAVADEVARVQTYNRAGIARPPALVVGDVIHVIQWGVANLPLQTLASTAADIHEIERTRS